MKTNHLKLAIESLLPITSKRTTLAILSMLRIESNMGQMTIHASNLDQMAKRHVPCDFVITPCCINAAKFATLVNATEEIDIVQSGDTLTVTGYGISKLKTLGVENFPPFPVDKFEAQTTDCMELAKSIEAVVWVSDKAPKDGFIYQHTFVELNPKQIITQCTNGYMMADVRKSLTTNQVKSVATLLCHSEFAPQFIEWLNHDGATLSIGKNYFTVGSDYGDWFAKLPELAWFRVPLQKMLDDKRETIGTLKRCDVLPTLTLIESLSRGQLAPSVDLEFCKSHLKITASTDNSEPYSREIDGQFKKLSITLSLEKFIAGVQKMPEQATAEHIEGKFFLHDDGDYTWFLAEITKAKESK